MLSESAEADIRPGQMCSYIGLIVRQRPRTYALKALGPYSHQASWRLTPRHGRLIMTPPVRRSSLSQLYHIDPAERCSISSRQYPNEKWLDIFSLLNLSVIRWMHFQDRGLSVLSFDEELMD